jgi:hypothetical protein
MNNKVSIIINTPHEAKILLVEPGCHCLGGWAAYFVFNVLPNNPCHLHEYARNGGQSAHVMH